MSERRDQSWYREEARRIRERAAALKDDKLRDSYLALAREYERLADLLEDRRSPRK